MHKRWNTQTIEEAKTLRETGWSYYAIAKKFNVTPATVKYWIDPDFQVKEQNRQAERRKKLQGDPDHQEKERARMQIKRQDPAYRESESIQNKEYRQRPGHNERRQKNRNVPPFVYAVLSRDQSLLKIGKSARTDSIVSNTRLKLHRRGVTPPDDLIQIWSMPGDERHEAFIQAYLSFRFAQPFESNTRICEWFSVGDTDPATIITELTRIYSLIPSDPV